MPRRRFMTVVCAVVCLSTVASRAHAQQAEAMAQLVAPLVNTSVVAKSETASPPDSVDLAASANDEARAAYTAAWAQRQAGEYGTAVAIADSALGTIARALNREIDATRRRELVELRERLKGVRDAAQHQLDAANAAHGGDDGSADPKVLNAPAVDELKPQVNEDVHRYIEFFTGAGRSTFERWLKRSGRYMNLFREVLKREGLPPDLVHLVFVESGFNVHAKSVSAAVGPWQFLQSTARLWGLTVNQWVDERRDPEKSTVAAARYLKHLYSIFGDWPLALASYNAGEGTVLRAIKNQGTTNYWDLRLPKQTEEYVPQFMAVLAIARDPGRYGFTDVDFDDPMDFDEVALKGTVDLRAMARLAGCSYDDLRDLNPAVRGTAAPGGDGITMLRVPQGDAEVILQKLQGGATVPASDLTIKHRVRRGETLQRIANQYHVNATQLARDNGVGRARPLKRGMVLTIRSRSSMAVQVASLEPNDPRRSTAYVPPRTIGVPAQLNGLSDAEGRLTITVHRGETIGQVADRYGVSTQDILRWNHLKTPKVRRGTRLKIRTGDAAQLHAVAASADSAVAVSVHAPRPSRRSKSGGIAIQRVVVVQPGETLGALASRHGTTVTRLKRANRLESSVIRAGQRIKIPA
jgi:membrane-bound lytic murein transglycosylase D